MDVVELLVQPTAVQATTANVYTVNGRTSSVKHIPSAFTQPSLHQWRSQDLKSAGSRSGAPVGSGSEAPRSQMYTNNLQLSNVLLSRFVAESVLHLPLPLPPKKVSESVRIP